MTASLENGRNGARVVSAKMKAVEIKRERKRFYGKREMEEFVTTHWNTNTVQVANFRLMLALLMEVGFQKCRIWYDKLA